MCQGSQDMERKTEYSAQRNMPFYSNIHDHMINGVNATCKLNTYSYSAKSLAYQYYSTLKFYASG